jgi:hypothetical protein
VGGAIPSFSSVSAPAPCEEDSVGPPSLTADPSEARRACQYHRSTQPAYAPAPNATDDDDNSWLYLDDKPVEFFIGVYTGCALFFYLLVATRSYMMVGFQINASRYFHAKMLKSTLRTAITFFETTPAGQILNRFTRDIYELDFRVPDLWHFMLMSVFRVVLNLVYITVVINFFGVFLAVFVIMYVE